MLKQPVIAALAECTASVRLSWISEGFLVMDNECVAQQLNSEGSILRSGEVRDNHRCPRVSARSAGDAKEKEECTACQT